MYAIVHLNNQKVLKFDNKKDYDEWSLHHCFFPVEKIHNVNGPAIIVNKEKIYYINGEKMEDPRIEGFEQIKHLLTDEMKALLLTHPNSLIRSLLKE